MDGDESEKPPEPSEQPPEQPKSFSEFLRDAFARVLKAGQDEGFERGFARGRSHGYKEGFDEGNTQGHKEGFEEGSAELKAMRAKVREKCGIDEADAIVADAMTAAQARLEGMKKKGKEKKT